MSENIKYCILDSKDIDRTISRLTMQILEHNKGVQKLTLVGIRTRGAPLAYRIAKKISSIEGSQEVPVGILDITLYRDDFLTSNKTPEVRATEIDFDINDCNVVLVDDVLYTGRTSRAALDAILDFGRPATIQLAVLIDRGHREMPIYADFIGKTVQTSPGEEVLVRVKEIDQIDEVVLIERSKP